MHPESTIYATPDADPRLYHWVQTNANDGADRRHVVASSPIHAAAAFRDAADPAAEDDIVVTTRNAGGPELFDVNTYRALANGAIVNMSHSVIKG